MTRTDSHNQAASTETHDSTWRLIARLMRMGLRHKARLAAALAVTVAMQLMSVAGLVSAGLAVDVLNHHANPTAPPPIWPLGLQPPTETPFFTMLMLVSASVLFFAVARAVGYYLGRLTDELLAQAIIVEMRMQLYRKLHTLPFAYFDANDSGTIINRVTGDVQSVRVFIQVVLLRTFTSLTTLVVFIGAMVAIHPGLTLACGAFLIVQAAVMLNYARHARPSFRIQRRLLDGLTSRLSEAVQGVRVIRSFGREREQIELFETESAEARDQRYSIWRLMSNHMPIVEGSGWLAVAVLIGYGGHLVHIGPTAGGIALGSIWVFFGMLRTIAQQLEPLVRAAGQMPEALTAAERIFAILDTEPAIASPDTPADDPDQPVRGEIEFRNVTFAYETDDEPVLRNISLHVKPGETIAIVGPTGSGKSTLLHLVGRFYDPQQGQVLVDGVDVREWDLSRLRHALGYVFQEPYLFSNTIATNIAFGDPDAEFARIEQAATIGEAHHFVTALDAGYDTVVGERGMTLSGGERQRLSIARAVLTNPAILILDDAMSAVDAGTEAAIQRHLDTATDARTTLVVAHRLSTLRRADRVIVIEDGVIHSQGTHDELMATDGHYREAAYIQLESDADGSPTAEGES